MKNIKDKRKIYQIILVTVSLIVSIILVYFLLISEDTRVIETKEKVNEKFKFLLEEESTELANFDMYTAQNVFMKDIIDQYKKGDYTINNPFVFKNPFILSPQTALIMFKTNKNERVTLTLKGKHNDDIVTTFEASKDHYIPVYGLYADYKNEILSETESGKKKIVYIDIEKNTMQTKINVLENKLGNTNGEFYFSTSSLGSATAAYDNYGELRWWLDIGYTKGMTMLQNGNLLISNDTPGPDTTSTSGVVEVDLFGYVHREYVVDGGYHHDAYEMENGNLIILTSDKKNNTFADYIVELDRKTGKVVKDWSLTEICKKVDPKVTEFFPTWGWVNSVTYDKKTNALILSVRNQNSVISIDYDKETFNWILGDSKYWSSSYDKYLIKGVGEEFIYPAGQHSVNITDEGYLSIFNNGYDAHDEVEISCSSLKDNASYAMLYKIDENKKEASVIWKFGGQEYFSYALSSYTYARYNHKVFNSGWHFNKDVNYDDPNCTQFSNGSYDSYLIEFDKNNNIVLKMHINESKFEVIKAPIYNLASLSVKKDEKKYIENYSNKKAIKTNTVENKEYIKLTEDEALKYASNEKLDLALYMDKGKLGVNLVAPDKSEVAIILINLNGDAYKYIIKGENDTELKSINTYNLPKGRYYIYAEIANITYNTLQHIIVE